MQYKTRQFLHRDIKEVLKIEEACFPKPWNQDAFRYLANSNGIVLESFGETRMLVVEYDHSVVGYIVWRFYQKNRMGHLLNIAVDVSHRRKGIARSLMNEMFAVLKDANASSCFLEVRETNKDAREFYEEMGMTPITRRIHYYDDEDAIIYQIIL